MVTPESLIPRKAEFPVRVDALGRDVVFQLSEMPTHLAHKFEEAMRQVDVATAQAIDDGKTRDEVTELRDFELGVKLIQHLKTDVPMTSEATRLIPWSVKSGLREAQMDLNSLTDLRGETNDLFHAWLKQIEENPQVSSESPAA